MHERNIITCPATVGSTIFYNFQRYVDGLFNNRLYFWLFNVLIITFLMEPAYISYSKTITISTNQLIQYIVVALHNFYSIGKLFSVVLVFLCFFTRLTKINAFLWWVVTFEAFKVLATVFNSGNVLRHLQYHAIPFIFLIYMQVVLEQNAALVLKALIFVLGLLIHANTISWLIYPAGIYVHWIGYKNCWFLGYDNIAVPLVLLATVVGLYRMQKAGRILWWDFSVIISGLCFVFGCDIATGIVSEAVFFVSLLLLSNRNLRSLLGRPKFIILAMFGFAFFLQFIGMSQQGLTGQALALLGKNTTFTNRTWVWHKGWSDLLEYGLICGRGFLTGLEYAAHFGWAVMTQLHSTYLHIVYEGGLISLALLLGMVLQGGANYAKFRDKFSSAVILAGLSAFMMVCQVECYSLLTSCFFITVSLLYNIGCLEESACVHQLGFKLVWHKHRDAP